MTNGAKGLWASIGIPVIVIVISILVGMVAGCVAPPGAAVAQAYEETITTGWTASEFQNTVQGGHEPDVTMYEGILLFAVDENGVLMKDENGDPYIDPLTSRVTAYLRIRSDQGDIGSSFAVAAQEFTKQAQIAADQFGKTMDLVASLVPMIAGVAPVGGGGADDAPPNVGDIADALNSPVVP